MSGGAVDICLDSTCKTVTKVSVPSYSDVKRKGDQMWRDNRGDVVLLVVDSTDDGQQRLLDSCLELSVASGSDCRKSKSGCLQECEALLFGNE